MRRLLSTLLVLSLGLLTLLLGLASLQGIFAAERDEARGRVDAERGALQEYARRTLEQLLEGELPPVQYEISRLLDDPLADTSNLLLVVDGHQRFPRPVSFKAGGETRAQTLYQELRSGGEVPVTDASSPWAERLQLHRELHDALRGRGHGQIERAFRNLLRHRTRYIIDSTLDLPSIIAALDELAELAKPNQELLSALLREGLRDGSIVVVEGLQPALLRRRDRFTEADFRFLAERVLFLSESTATKVDDFRARMAEPLSTPVRMPVALAGPSLLLGGQWYARTDDYGAVFGTAVNLDELMSVIDEQMRGRALIQPDDELRLPELTDEIVPIANLPFNVSSPRFEAGKAKATENYRIKSAFLVGSFGLALVAVVLATVLASRKQKFVELKNDFVATVSHELRTPLASLRLMAETIERRTAGLVAARDYPTRMVREIDDLNFLVENILSFNRLDKGRWRPRHERVNLHALVEDVARELEQWSSKPVVVRVQKLEHVVLRADPELLRLLLRNLGKNACSYCTRDTIELDVTGEIARRRLRRVFRVTVTDNGVGIPRREHRRIFGDFYRGGGMQRSRGSGLGLAICRKTMAAHRGSIRIVSSSAAGTSFALEFPVALMGEG